MSRILITGAGGFIGSRLVEALRTRHEIFGMVRQAPSECVSGVHWIEQDLTQPLDPARMPARVDTVIHLAQSRMYRQFPAGATDIFEVNVHGTFRMLEYARQAGVGCFVFASSGGIYGTSYERFVESDPVNPLGFYLSSKYAAEILLANYHAFFRTVVLRLFFVYGPGQKGMVIPTLLAKVQRGEEIVIEGNPGIRINPLHVEDAVRAFKAAAERQASDLFNLAGDESVTITELVRLIEQAVGKQALVRYSQARQQGNLVGDNMRMKEFLAVHPQRRLLEGLRGMV